MVVSLSRCTVEIFLADTVTIFSPDKIQTQHRQRRLHKEESLFFVKGVLVAPLATAGVRDDVAQELQMPFGPEALEDVEEPMPSPQRSRHA